ncbi:MAG: glycoside hydrolase family 3 C-terminal domain-containing protein, partial [Promethearchaeota archaeon]
DPSIKKGKRWQWIKDAVEKGLLTKNTIDKSLNRLFTARFLLGMFDPPEMVPYTQIPFEVNDSEEHRALATQAARESIVLLKNENNILPLDKNIRAIAVMGPSADDLDVLVGNYHGNPSRHTTFLQGIKNKVASSTEVYYAKGCDLIDKSKDEFNEAIEIAKKSDIIIMILGISTQFESEEGAGQRSEAKGDRIDLNLPKVQEELLKEIHAIGKPIILALTSGSALSVNFANKHIPAILEVWYPGEEGGTALADIIFGDYNPAGRLPVTFYKSIDQVPDFRDYSMDGRTYRYFEGPPLYSFGYGLSYTKFKYSNLQIPRSARTDDSITLRIDVENIGKRLGDEIIQIYLNKRNISSNAPIRELQGFERITLKVGEKKTVAFTLISKNLSIFDGNGNQIVKPGKISVSIGGCQPGFSEDNENIIEGSFEITGEILKIS